jgi:hypothetical protein
MVGVGRRNADRAKKGVQLTAIAPDGVLWIVPERRVGEAISLRSPHLMHKLPRS